MKISIVTLFPNMFTAFFNESIVKRAQDKKLVEIEYIDPREFTKDSYQTVDEKSYGGGVGMVMKVEPLVAAIRHVSSTDTKVIYPSAKGKVFDQKKAQDFSKEKHVLFIVGHYEGVDERVMKYVDEEVSLGDFVVTGGEIATAAIVDAIVRLVPDVLKHEEATAIESFFNVSIDDIMKVVNDDKLIELKKSGASHVQLLEYPHYTRPEEFEGDKVPEILLSGNHKEIEKWRIKMAYEETCKKRPDLLEIK